MACGYEPQKDSDAVTSDYSNTQLSDDSSLEKGQLTLSMTPISFAEATGENSKMKEVEPCPFVSDESIKASVRSDFEIIRREVSNTLCRWSYNAGFSIIVTIEETATAKPISERKYNLDVNPMLLPQDDPGSNAFVLSDTAWDKPLPYAFTFEKDNKLIFIRYTGFKTNPEIMRPVADEIAQRMLNAPIIEHQLREEVLTFKACDVWTDQDIKIAFDTKNNASIAPGANGRSTCSWTLYEDGVSSKRTVAFKLQKVSPGTKAEYEYDSYKPISSNGETYYLRKSESTSGLYVHLVSPVANGYFSVTVSDSEGEPTNIAMKLLKNLQDRIVK